ncbi:hypothetical protein CFRS1_v002981 [Colletotrichum fructicola]|nr:hypothetical protein CFRS1_v002981 [Colletotrichum fructicola]
MDLLGLTTCIIALVDIAQTTTRLAQALLEPPCSLRDRGDRTILRFRRTEKLQSVALSQADLETSVLSDRKITNENKDDLRLNAIETITKSVAWATTIILSFYALGFERSNVNEEYLTAGQFWSGYLARASMMKKVIYFNTDLSPEAFLLVMIVYGAGFSGANFDKKARINGREDA